ncbi:alanine racemase [Pelovirga terrestris]|uniref:Alanine racemase n=1 Tax=Pelovirga terrestris TaxID=2771352 RepID=A0A8J6UKX1_9BACT|nr:alanine racemase [Pelovirga terrestris]MBD1400172.1 alanine racemase [Pelovirga terrestris]
MTGPAKNATGNGLPGRQNRSVNTFGRPTWADIDLRALHHNLGQIDNLLHPGQRVMAVVKADAYGHGAVPVSRELVGAGISDFAVATLEEAQALRCAGIDANLLVLGGCFPGQEEGFIRDGLMPALLDLETAERLNAAASLRRQQIRVHLKIDSGMGRVGFTPEQLQAALPRLKNMPGLVVQGLMSHLACADERDSVVSVAQLQLFSDMIALVRASGINPVDFHLSNSAGIAGRYGPECTLVRPGIMLYGGLPGDDFAQDLDLRPVMHLRSCVAQLRKLPAGSGISYGHQYRATEPIQVAVLPIGYADGYNRLLSNRGQGIVRGCLVPVVGRVCMDWIMLDVSTVADVAIGDPVTLLGSSQGITISGDAMAAQLGTISYEVFCRISARVPRRYLPCA